MTHSIPSLRWLRHFWLDQGDVRRHLGPAALARLQGRVHASESGHSGELRLCVEGGLHWRALRQGQSARARALDLFSALRVWDTEHNNGVLIYLLLAERRIEILADRGLTARIEPSVWAGLTGQLATRLRQDGFEQGLNQAVDAVTDLLTLHFPLSPGERKLNELPDQVVVI